MKLKMLMVLAVSMLIVGCATNSDIEGLQSQIDGLRVTVAQVSVDTASASVAASNALVKAKAAEVAANDALVYIIQTDNKVDIAFKNAMSK